MVFNTVHIAISYKMPKKKKGIIMFQYFNYFQLNTTW